MSNIFKFLQKTSPAFEILLRVPAEIPIEFVNPQEENAEWNYEFAYDIEKKEIVFVRSK